MLEREIIHLQDKLADAQTLLKLLELRLKDQEQVCAENHTDVKDFIYREEQYDIIFKEMRDFVHRAQYRNEKIHSREYHDALQQWIEVVSKID